MMCSLKSSGRDCADGPCCVKTSASEAQAYLSWNDVGPHWEAASLLPQRCGMLFNLRLTITRSVSGRPDQNGNAALVSKLTHELDSRIGVAHPPRCCIGCTVMHGTKRHCREPACFFPFPMFMLQLSCGGLRGRRTFYRPVRRRPGTQRRQLEALVRPEDGDPWRQGCDRYGAGSLWQRRPV
jgi:hypothetical protein